MKRKLAIAFLAFLLALVGGLLALLRTPWAAARVCALAEDRVASATGLPLSLGTCRIDPLRLEVTAESVRLGTAAAPIFTADTVRARLALVQALGKRVQLEEVSAVRPRVTLALPPAAKDRPPVACPPPALSQFDVHHLQVEDGSLDLVLPGGERIVVSRVDVRSGTALARRSLRSIATGVRLSRAVVEIGPTLVEAGGRQTVIAEARLDADVALDLSRLEIHGADADVEGLKLSAQGEIVDLCRPRLGLEVGAQAPLPAIFAFLGAPDVRSEGTAAVTFKVSGRAAAPAVSGELKLSGARIKQYVPGNARAGFHLAGQEIQVDKLEIPFTTGGSAIVKATLTPGREVGLRAELETRQVEFGELMARLGIEGAHVMMRLSTKATVAGTVWPLSLSGETGVDVQDFRVLDHTWEKHVSGEDAVLDFKRARLDSQVRILPDGIELEKGRVRVGQETLGVTGKLHFADAGGFQLALDGAVDLTEVAHVSAVPYRGRAEVSGTVRAAPYGEPRVEAQVRASAFHFLALDLQELAASVTYDRRILRVRGGEGVKGGTRYGVEVAVDLGRTPVHVLSGRLTADGRLHDLFDAVMPWLPGTRRVRDALDAQVTLEATASGGVPEVDAVFDARLGAGALWGRAFESGRAQVHIVKGGQAVFDRAVLRRGDGEVRGEGTIGFEPPSPWDLNLEFAGVRLGDLDLPGESWSGTGSGTLVIGGSMEAPTLRFAASGDGVAVAEVAVGAVQVGGNLVDRRLSLTGSTGGVRFTGSALLEGDMPFEAHADLDLEDVSRFVPGGPPAGLRAEVKGEASASGNLADLGRARADVRLDRLYGGYADFRVENREPIRVVVDRGRVDVASFTLHGANTEFTLSGTRTAAGSLDLAVGGSLDLRLLGGLVPAIVRTRGELSLDAHVTGTGEAPLLVGVGRVRDGGFRIRELPIEFAALSGDLSFSQNLVLFEGLSATVNGGKAALRGEIELARFEPTRIRVEATLDAVPMTLPSYVPSMVAGQISAQGTPNSMVLSGQLHVLQAKYAERFELERRMLEFGKKKPEVKPYDKSGEWLRYDLRIIVDGDARVDNDLVRGAVRGDLTLTGSLAAMGLVGSLSLTPGSRATYRGNDFNLSRGVVTFTDRHRIQSTLDVTGDATVRDYRVSMQISGSLEDPQVQLTSSPALSQQDIITLLSLGYTSRDTTLTPGIGAAATGLAAEALFAASGLNDQLRRFLPPGGLFQDFSVRITSAYSQSTYQVEPKMEFESRALGDRLRLRYLAPLAGGRGQKAQAEYRFGEHASIQGVWDNDNPNVAGADLGLDLKLRWEWGE